MIPLKDTVPLRRFPWVNTLLIIINIGVFIYELTLGSHINKFLSQYALVPATYFSTAAFSFPRLFPLISSMFMHAGWLHIGGNMLYLFIFGDNVEDAMGHFRYLAFYLLAGVLSAIAHIYTNIGSSIPSLGASGAIAGVLGAYIVLYPKSRVATLIFLIFFFQIIEVPAIVFLGLWFLLQLVSGAAAITKPASGSSVAYFAHIGGFVAGMILVFFLKRTGIVDYLRYY
ncbi:MAG: rhomboid family intramembrane serine protease [Actinobacteria bacterium]|nr:MAG: rhomboid family intramembrane serine protease [Actinomycetota bacterium]